MNNKKKIPIKALIQNGIIFKNKKLFLAAFNQTNGLRASSQLKSKNSNFNNLLNNHKNSQIQTKTENLKNSNKSCNKGIKNFMSCSTGKIAKIKKEHESNLKKINELTKLLFDLEIQNMNLNSEIQNLKDTGTETKTQINTKDSKIRELTNELNSLKETHENKNQEYLRLRRNNSNYYQANTENNIHSHSNIFTNISSEENNNYHSVREISINEGMNRILDRRINENNEGVEILNNMLSERFGNVSSEENEDYGEPMTFEQIDALPFYNCPKIEEGNNEIKCNICGFDLCYNDIVTKLEKCQHIFHKECLGNFLIEKQGSKCPTCKTSII